METPSMHDMIVSIKHASQTQHLSISAVQKLLNAEGVFPSETTLRRLFADGSEDNDSFNFEQTLRPIARVLVDNHPAENDATQAQLELYRQICLYKHDTIENLNEKIDSLHKQIDNMKAEHTSRCRKCEENTETMKEQIAVKDRRMDEQAQRLDRLLERIENLTDLLLEKSV